MHTRNPGFIYFELCWEKRHQVKLVVKKETELTHVSLREVTDNWQHPFGSRDCQSWRDDEGLEMGQKGGSRSLS